MERDAGFKGAETGANNFNSHAHVERDVYGALLFGDYDHFNSHAHVERDPVSMCHSLWLWDFNSHAHVERDISAPDITVTV